jgi:tetratricopeptide (TPR) repeat protein
MSGPAASPAAHGGSIIEDMIQEFASPFWQTVCHEVAHFLGGRSASGNTALLHFLLTGAFWGPLGSLTLGMVGGYGIRKLFLWYARKYQRKPGGEKPDVLTQQMKDIFAQLKKQRELLEQIEANQKRMPRLHSDYFLMRAEDYLARADKELAQTMIDRAIEEDPTNPAPWLLSGSIHLKEADYSGALKRFGEVTRRADKLADQTEGAYWSGHALLALGKVPQAVAEFDRALRNDPQYYEAYYHKAIALRANEAEAVAPLSKAMEIYPRVHRVASEDPLLEDVVPVRQLLQTRLEQTRKPLLGFARKAVFWLGADQIIGYSDTDRGKSKRPGSFRKETAALLPFSFANLECDPAAARHLLDAAAPALESVPSERLKRLVEVIGKVQAAKERDILPQAQDYADNLSRLARCEEWAGKWKDAVEQAEASLPALCAELYRLAQDTDNTSLPWWYFAGNDESIEAYGRFFLSIWTLYRQRCLQVCLYNCPDRKSVNTVLRRLHQWRKARELLRNSSTVDDGIWGRYPVIEKWASWACWHVANVWSEVQKARKENVCLACGESMGFLAELFGADVLCESCKTWVLEEGPADLPP